MSGKSEKKLDAEGARVAVFVYAHFSGGGLETRIAEQVKVFRAHGVKSYLFCHSCSEEYREIFDGVMEGMNCCEPDGSGQLLCEDALWNAEHLAEFCLEKRASYIDCHPFWGVVPAVLAGAKLNLPVTYTVHGVDSAEFCRDNLARIFLRYGLSRVFIVGEYLRERAERVATCPVELAPNGVMVADDYVTEVSRSGKWALASRLDQSKTPLILDFLPIFKQTPIKQLDIYGDGAELATLKATVKNLKLQNRIKIRGWQANIPEILVKETYGGVIGMGRVALEALMANLPTVILGYGGVYGGVTADNLDEVIYHNFTSWQTLDAEVTAGRIQDVCDHPEKYQIRRIVAEKVDSEKIWARYLKTVSGITPNDSSIAQGLWRVLAEHPKLNLLDSMELAAEISCMLGDELLAMRNSSSWRMTRPLRQVKARLQRDK